jgi:hypothetical protein
MEQLTVLLGGWVRPERMGEKGIDKDEQGKQAGDPPYLPTQHDEKTGNQLEDAEYDRPGGDGRTREYASADEQAFETETDENAWNQYARGNKEASVIHNSPCQLTDVTRP